MSSFEPDRRFARPSFEPSPHLAGLATAPFAGLEGDGSEAARSLADEAADATPCTAAEHAELERAAFERGVASAARDTARVERACEAFEAAALAMANASTRMLHANREQMLALAAEIARSWIGEELAVDASRIAGPLERALALCPGASVARIRLHPDIFDALGEDFAARRARWSEQLAVELEPDARLEPAGFRIEAEPHAVGSGLDTFVERLRSALAEAFEAPPPAQTPASESAAC